MEMRVEYDMCAAPHGPTDRFRIAPAFMANRDAKCQRTRLEYPPPGTERIGAFLGRIELNFVLETGDRSVLINYQCGGQQSVIDHAFGTENNCDRCLRSDRRDGRPGALQECRVGGRYRLPYSSIAGNETFRKTDEAGALDGCLSDSLFGQHDRLFGCRREADVRERNSKHVHL